MLNIYGLYVCRRTETDDAYVIEVTEETPKNWDVRRRKFVLTYMCAECMSHTPLIVSTAS